MSPAHGMKARYERHDVKAVFAVPGDLETPTGGYAYARRLLRAARGEECTLEHLSLPGGFPDADDRTEAEAADLLGAVPEDQVLLIDGLAYGALTSRTVAAISAPIVALCHHPLALETGLAAGRAAALKETETTALAAARHVIATSNATAKILMDQYGVEADKITVAPPGTDPAPRAVDAGGPPCRILSVGSVSARKGHDLLIAALAELAHLDWTLKIVGPIHDIALAQRHEAQIEEAGLSDRVALAGPLPAAAVAAAYQSADLFALASRYEGFGMAFTEAMSHGLPTMGLHSPAVEEATAGAACLVAPDDLQSNLRLLIADKGTRDALAEMCWTAAQTFLRWPQTANIVLSVLRETRS